MRRLFKFAVAAASPPRSTLAAAANPPESARCPACHRSASVYRRASGRLVCRNCAEVGEVRTPAEIQTQREAGWPDFHPEDFCHRCGQRNIKSWSVDSALWKVAELDEGLIVCPQCFTEAHAEATGDWQTWTLTAAEVAM